MDQTDSGRLSHGSLRFIAGKIKEKGEETGGKSKRGGRRKSTGY